MRHLRLAALTTSFPVCHGSTSGIFVARLLRYMPSTLDATVVTPAYSLCPEPAQDERIQLHTFRYAPKRWEVLAHGPGGIPVTLRNNRLLLLLVPSFLASMTVQFLRRAKDADVLHANWAICGCIAGLVGRALGLPVVTTLRGEDVARVHTSMVDRYILRTALRLSTAVVTVSDSIRDSLVTHYPRWKSKIQTISNGVDDEFLRVGEHRPSVSLGGTVRFLTIGSLIPRKGTDQIITAVSLCRNRDKVVLDIVGCGPERERLEKQVKDAGLTGRIFFRPSVDPTAVATLLDGADVFVLASHSEGRPNVVLEAMASGLPVIATNIDGVNELVSHGKTGLLFRDGAVHELAGHIDAVAAGPDHRARLGSQAHRAITEQGLRWDNTAARYFELYQALRSA